MADTKISALSAASAVADADLFVLATGGSNYKATRLQIATFGTGSAGMALHNVADEVTNYERGFLRWVANVLEIGSEKGGTGTGRAVNIKSGAGVTITPTSANLTLASGQLIVPDGAAATPPVGFSSETNSGWYRSGASDVRFSLAGTDVARFASGVFGLGTSSLTFGASIGSPDVYLVRDAAANTLAQRNGVSAQTFRIYNTFTDASNYERGSVRWNSNVFEVSTGNSGTGSARGIAISSSAGLTITVASGSTVEQRNGVVAQTFRVYNTFTDTSNYERLGVTWSSNVCTISCESNGTGTTRGLRIGILAASLVGFHAATPTAQRAGAAQAAVGTTGATNVAPYGFTTAAQADALVTLVNELRAALVEKGLIKGSA